MANYSGTTNPDVVNKGVITVEEINLQEYVDKYLALKAQLLALPQLKSTPDAETLAYYNREIAYLIDTTTDNLRRSVEVLYNELKPIQDAGLLPSKYDDEMTQMENFINS